MRNKPSKIAAVLALLFLFAATVRAADKRILHGHVPADVAKFNLQPLGRLPATNRLNLAIGLPLHNQETLTNLLQQLYNPDSTNFHRYLTPEQFTAKFGPTEADYQAVLQFARTNGLTVVQTYGHRKLVDVSATVSDIEKAFNVRLLVYQHPTENRQFYAPDVEPSVDTNVPILTVSGLNNYFLPHPGAHQQPNTSPGGASDGPGTGPKGFFQGKDFRNAYAPGVTLDGSGQNVGLVEFDGYFASDITTYENQAGLPHVSITNVSVKGFSETPDNNTNYISEVSLDIEMVVSMAPNINKLFVFEGGDFDDILGSMVTFTQINQFSASWVGFSFDSTGDGFLQQLAAQGQTSFQASGDGDAYNQPITGPCDDLYVTSVGGTQLTMDSTATNYLSETVWNSGFQVPGWGLNGNFTQGTNNGGYWGSGGGISSTYSIPNWQQGVNMTAVGGSSTQRNIPDVALTANSIWVDYFNGLSGPFEGTSCAAPLWAGFAALVNQQAASHGKPPVGFLNPAIYIIGEGQDYNAAFHDITNGNDTWPNSPNLFKSATGYDLCTGWGTPKGSATINALEGFGGPVYVDFNYTGPASNGGDDGPGSFDFPFKTLAGGVGAVKQGGTIIIKTAGSSSETMTISKPMTIIAVGGSATVGH